MKTKEKWSIKKKRLENRYAVYHKTKGFVCYMDAMNIFVVRNKYPSDKGYTVHKRKGNKRRRK